VVIIVPLYILGLLLRFGPQHGYRIKELISGQLAYFTEIKLPTIYYHMEKMEQNGLLTASREKDGSRPEKTVYEITDEGARFFRQKLRELLNFEFRPAFASDGVFYFFEYLDVKEISKSLEAYIDKLHRAIDDIEKQKKDTLGRVPPDMKTMVDIIFSHRLHHYRAELDWAVESIIV
jgi:DNA-binding PadR family transcriptional regulator